MAIKYGMIATLVLLGVFAYAKRDFVLDAFDWQADADTLAIPAFDPAAAAKGLASAPPSAGAVRVAKAADSRRAALNGVPAGPTEGIALQGGTATLAGRVLGPGGAVAGATVRVERFVGERSAALDVTTDEGGNFALGAAPGGRYRLRAWQSPGLAQLGSEVTFVAEGEQRNFTLEVKAPSGRDVAAEWSGGGWLLGGTPSVAVTVTEPFVNRDGQVELRGSAGLPVTLVTGGALSGGGGTVTNGGGQASFSLVCSGIGSTSASLAVGSYTRTLDVPGCGAPPTTTTPPATAPPAPPAAGTPAPAPPPAPTPDPAPAPPPSGTPGA